MKKLLNAACETSLWFWLGLVSCGCQTVKEDMPIEPMPAEFRETHYAIIGQVRSPGRYEYLGPTTILNAVAEADGFTDFANAKKVVILRDGGQRVAVNCIKAKSDSSLNLEIFPGDRINVPMRGWLGCDF